MSAGADPFAELEQQHAASQVPAGSADPFADLESEHAAGGGVLPRFGRGVLRGAGLPDSTKQIDPDTAAISEIHNHIANGRYGEAMKAAGSYLAPKALLGPGYSGSPHEISQAYGALKEGRYFDAFKHSAAALYPPLAPAASASEDNANSQDNAGQLGQESTSMGLSLLGLKGVNGLRDQVNGAPPVDQPAREQNFLSASKPLVEVLQPKNAGEFQDNVLRRAMPLLKEQEGAIGPITRQNADLAGQQYLDKNRTQFKQYMDQAEQSGKKVDGGATADAMVQSLPEKLRFEKPALYQKLVDESNKYRRSFAPSEFESYLKTTNKQLDAFYAANADARNSALGANARTAMLEAQANAYRDSLYKTVDPENGGDNVRELQKRYGAVKDFMDRHRELNDRLLTQPTLSPVQRATGMVGDAAKMFVDPKKLALQKLTETPTADAKFEQAFKKYKGGKLGDVGPPTPADPFNSILRPTEPSGEFTRQRSLDEQTLPDSRMDTDYRQQTQDLPVHGLVLHKGEPAPTFNWQKFLFGEDPNNPEKRTAINPRKIRKPPNPSSHGNANGTPPAVEDPTPFRHGPW